MTDPIFTLASCEFVVASLGIMTVATAEGPTQRIGGACAALGLIAMFTLQFVSVIGQARPLRLDFGRAGDEVRVVAGVPDQAAGVVYLMTQDHADVRLISIPWTTEAAEAAERATSRTAHHQSSVMYRYGAPSNSTPGSGAAGQSGESAEGAAIGNFSVAVAPVAAEKNQ